jgi:hypothetical protein
MGNKFFRFSNYDIIYLLLTLIFFLIDIFTKNKVLDTISLILILLGFVIIVINAVCSNKDDSSRHINYLCGYLSFLLVIIFLAVFSFLNAYTDFTLVLSDILRYITTLMFLVYVTLYSIMRRTVR